jgi:multicomponent Na+:H+ antiporter subunit B
MSSRVRTSVFLVAGIVFLCLYCYSVLNMPPWGGYRGPYGDFISQMAVYERHVTDVVNAVNYDYRAFDTLEEEFILFSAVLGVCMLLRRDEDGSGGGGGQKVRDEQKMSTAVRAINLPAALVTLIFGFYIGTHGALTPGGGFQAGVILATAPLLVYVCENPTAFRRITSSTAIEVIEGIGAGSYAVIGLAAVAAGLPLLTNFLPLGKTGTPFASGTIALISFCVGVEVTAAFTLVISTYLEEVMAGGTPEN